MKISVLAVFLAAFGAKAENWDCVRVKVQPSSLCENLRTSIDHSLCGQKPVVKNSRVECKNEFFAEFIFEADDQIYRATLTKGASGIWSAGQPVGEPIQKPVVVLPPETKPSTATPSYKFWAEFRVRAESNKETNLANTQSPTYMRLKPGVEWQVQPKLSLTAEAQAVKNWGQETYSASSTTANSRSRNQDGNLTLTTGFIKYLPLENTDLRVGRSSLNYGDGLLIGDDDWSSGGTSFDMISGRWSNKWGWIEGFGAKVVDRSITTDTPGNEDLNGVYVHTQCHDGDSNLDVYAFDYQNSTNVDAAGNATTSIMYEVWSYGARIKSKHDFLNYRMEYTKQSNSVSANQFDGEVGTPTLYDHKFSAGYFDADEDFNQLYPSTHKWLGYAGVLGRRNIQGEFLRVTGNKFEHLTAEVTYFWFNRHSETKAAFSESGTALATASRAKDIGQELDVELKYDLEKELQLLVGYADFVPGSYIKDQYQNIDPVKWYVQLTAKF